MPITEIKQYSRPNVDTPFFSDIAGSLPGYTASRDAVAPYVTNGSVTINRMVSDDQLTQTSTITYQDLATYSAVDTQYSLHMDSEFINYCDTYGVSRFDVGYTHTGIDQPFKCAVTYTFDPAATMPNGQLVSEFLIATVQSPKIINVDVNINNIVATFQYDNSADFTTNLWIDVGYTPGLQTAGVTRSYSYSLV